MLCNYRLIRGLSIQENLGAHYTTHHECWQQTALGHFNGFLLLLANQKPRKRTVLYTIPSHCLNSQAIRESWTSALSCFTLRHHGLNVFRLLIGWTTAGFGSKWIEVLAEPTAS